MLQFHLLLVKPPPSPLPVLLPLYFFIEQSSGDIFEQLLQGYKAYAEEI